MHQIGIDFGTSFCTSSRLNPVTGKPEVITFHETGLQKMPSLVYYSPDGVMVGDAVADMLENSAGMPEDERADLFTYTHASIKRQLQRGMKVYGRDGQVITQAEIISEILRKIKCNAEQTCFHNELVESVVLTHPVRFAEWQKEILVEAAGLAGFAKIELMEEPVAAAKGYVVSRVEVGSGILVYDFGGGTFDVAFVSMDEEGEYRVPVLPEGDLYCGGDDLDTVLYYYWENQIKREHNRPVNANSGVDVGFLMRCRKYKEALSIRSVVDQYEILPPPGFVRQRLRLDRSTFDSLIEEVVAKTITRTRSLLGKVEEAGFKVDTVVLIGGSSRLPLVVEKLKEILPIEPLKTMYVDAAVAMGAIVPTKVYTVDELWNLCWRAYKLYKGEQYNEAVCLWKKAAANECAEALLNLGICYHQGLGTDINLSLAADYYEAAAGLGDVVSAYNRSMMLLEDLQSNESWKRLIEYIQGSNLLVNGGGEKLLSQLLAIKSTPDTTIFKRISRLKDFILVKGDVFGMGSENGAADENPVHQVILSDYYISKYPITQKLWYEIMGSNSSYFGRDYLPIGVSWFDCVSFCNALSRHDGLDECYSIDGELVILLSNKYGYRLPTEAEWEFAARGGQKSTGLKYAGGNNIGEAGWYSSNSGGKTHPVGQKRANELGLFDMSGNTWEWCWDWYGSSYPSSFQTNPLGPDSGTYRVRRGGSCDESASNCRTTYRGYTIPTNKYGDLGFRPVLVL